jgi:LPS-assembly lipoprotein
MWWSRRRSCGLALTALLALGTPLAGCGWHPLYGENLDAGGGPSAAAEMAYVHIQPIADRVGQQLYNMLRDRMNPLGVPQDPRYDLVVTLKQTTVQELINPDQTASRIDITLTADYNLFTRAKPGQSVFHATSRTTTAYDLLDDPYASVVSADDAKRRGAQSLADEISNRVAVYLSEPPGS